MHEPERLDKNHPRRFSSVLAGIGYPPEVCERFEHVILPFELMPHQLRGLSYALYYPRSGLFFEPRTGKTIVMQLAAIFYAHYGVGTVQIMPPGLFLQFSRDYDSIQGHGLTLKHLTEGPKRRDAVFDAWEKGLANKPNVILLSQPIFKVHWASLYGLGYTHLHFDECHQGLQDEKNQISRAVRAFLDGPRSRLVLSTGTPIPTQVTGVYGTLKLLYPEAYRSRRAFEERHVIHRPIMVPGSARSGFAPRQIQVVSGYQKLEELSEVLYRQAIHAAKRDVLKLDAPNIQLVPYELDSKHAGLYRRLIRERVLTIETSGQGQGEELVIDARTAQKLRQTALQLVSCPETFDETIKKNALFETLKDLLNSLDIERNKVAIFANYTRTVRHLAGLFSQYGPQTVYGPNGPAKNAQAVEVFRNDPACRLLIANPVAGGVGFKLGDVCTTVVFAEPTASPGQFDQALSRVMLMGQTEPVLCYILKAEGTIWPLAIEAMIGKVKDINAVMRSRKTIFEALVGEIELTDEIRLATTESVPFFEDDWTEPVVINDAIAG